MVIKTQDKKLVTTMPLFDATVIEQETAQNLPAPLHHNKAENGVKICSGK